MRGFVWVETWGSCRNGILCAAIWKTWMFSVTIRTNLRIWDAVARCGRMASCKNQGVSDTKVDEVPKRTVAGTNAPSTYVHVLLEEILKLRSLLYVVKRVVVAQPKLVTREGRHGAVCKVRLNDADAVWISRRHLNKDSPCDQISQIVRRS